VSAAAPWTASTDGSTACIAASVRSAWVCTPAKAAGSSLRSSAVKAASAADISRDRPISSPDAFWP